MKQLQLSSIAMVALCFSACGSESRSDDEFRAFAQRVSALEDRDALTREIIQAVSEVRGSEIDAATQAKLDVIAARVDELDGLFYRVDTRAGATIKFFETAPGEIHVAFIGPPEAGEAFSMKGLNASEIYQLAVPDSPVPTALVQAAEREAELQRRIAPASDWIGEPGPPQVQEVSTEREEHPPTGSIIQHHLVARHAPISNYDWQHHCFAYGTQCEPGLKGARSWTATEQYGYEWRYMLNVRDPNGSALGSIMTGTFKTTGIGWRRECQLYGDWCDDGSRPGSLFYKSGQTVGPIVSGVGDMVVVNTAAERYCLTGFLWPGCASTGWKLANHHGDFVAGPNAQWHLASRPRNDVPSWSIWGSYFLP